MNIKQLLIATILLLSSGAYGQSFEETKLLAEQGDANAQNWLGKMYHQGNGAIKNYKKAYVWFNIAHANGYTTAGSRRDLVGQSMSSSDVSAAQDKSSSCIESDYVDC